MAKLTAEQVAECYEAELIGADDVGDLVELIAEQYKALCMAEDDRANDERVIREQTKEIERLREESNRLHSCASHWACEARKAQRMYDEQTARIKELESDAAVGRLVRTKLASGNSVPIERCVIRADEVAAIDAAWHQQQAAECFRQIGEAP